MIRGDSVVVVWDTGEKVGGVGLLAPAGISSVKRLPSGYVGVGLAGAGEVVDSSICTQFSSAAREIAVIFTLQHYGTNITVGESSAFRGFI